MPNPAFLLNPKAYQQAQQGEKRKESPVPHQRPQNVVFQFENANAPSGFAQYANSPPRNINSNGFQQHNGFPAQHQTPGMGHMLERMHNISNREIPILKRRRVGPEEGNENVKGNFAGGNQGGILGQYMKDQQAQGRIEATKKGTAAPVDLTSDDEVKETGDPGDKEVCYGRVDNAAMNAFKVPTPREGTKALDPNAYWPICKLVLKRKSGDTTTVVNIYDSTRQPIGCLDVNTAIGLVALLDFPKIHLRTAARILARKKKPGDLPPGSDCSERFDLDLILYGPRKWAPDIGRHLSQKQVWLRSPLMVEAGIQLCNPHANLKPQGVPRPGASRCTMYSGPPTMRTVEEIRSDVIGMFDTLENTEKLPEAQQDPRIVTPLLGHQKQGLYFMNKREQGHVYGGNDADECSLWKLRVGGNGQRSFYNVITGQEQRGAPSQVLGGILADMMGLGKTLSILSLIMGSLDQAEEWAQKLAPAPTNHDEVPLIRNCKTTLLVSPLSTIANWEEQIQTHIQPGAIKYHIYHGGTKCRDPVKMSDYDLIITTYGSVASEFNRRAKGKDGPYPLEELNWFRIVLDEAHMIREQATLQSKSICRLQAQRRWAVTGTPVQNRLDDLGALLKFLRITPFDDKRAFAQYILAPCKNADPEILPKLRLLVDSFTLRRLKDRINLPPRHDHIIKLSFSPEEQQIYNIFAKNASDRVQVLTGNRTQSLGGKAYVHILQSILRLRLICAHGRELLSDEDMKITAGITKDSAIDLDSDENDEKPALTAKQAYDTYNLMRETNNDMCHLCNTKIGRSENAENEEKDEVIGHLTPCFHLICNGCITDFKKAMDDRAHGSLQTDCVICNQEIRTMYFGLKARKVEEDEDARAEIKDDVKRIKQLGHYTGPHTKTKALIEDLRASEAESNLMPDQPPIKSVIFSGWTSHLDLIQIALDDNGMSYTRLDGKMSRTARSAALDTFKNDQSVTIILVSISAGGLGLNLTTANKVYVMEPQYNPAAEAQAIDRVHRLGQAREVETIRYIMDNSFEEKMLELQEKKKKLASLSMDRESGKVDNKREALKQRLEDLRSLFK
jgi:SNF2 family DNA or RNA helicase